jgi:ABC-2 type transport system permease protein
MKILDIALKDMTQSFRSTFALIFMFAVPLLVTGMFYFMFGNITDDNGGFDLPRTKVVIVNLDEGGEAFQSGMANMPGGMQGDTLGEMVVDSLQGENFRDLLEVTLADDAAAARGMVDRQEVGVAIILPANFSASYADVNGTTEIEIYKDPTLTLGPSIVESVLTHFVDGFSGVKIAVNAALQRAETGEIDYAQVGQIVNDYMAASLIAESDTASVLLDVQSSGTEKPKNLMATMIGGIMAGMMIFYAFFTGASTAESILREEERGTLPRLFTTPTSQATILAGKFLSVAMTVIVQVVVLITAGRLIFQIEWGALLPLALVVFGLVITASSFGILINSLLKSTKQSGVVFGGFLTVTGMIGMIDVFTGNPGGESRFGNIPLLMPQGWVERSLIQTMNGATTVEILPYIALMLVGSAIFFAIGVWRFQRRYA